MATHRELSRSQATSGAADLSAPGDLSSSAASFARYLRAVNIAPATLKTYAEAVRTLGGFLAERGMPTDVAVISREHVEAFITDQLARWRPATAANRFIAPIPHREVSDLRPPFTGTLAHSRPAADPRQGSLQEQSGDKPLRQRAWLILRVPTETGPRAWGTRASTSRFHGRDSVDPGPPWWQSIRDIRSITMS